MESAERDPLVDLERHRARLEETVAKLRKSLQHWQTWEFEYEALKEELQRFKGQPSSDDMVTIGRAFGGDMVNEKEVKELVGYGKSVQRNGAQVVDMISRRLDYVQHNAQTVQKQLDGAEKKLQATLVLLEPGLDEEDGLPLTDIHEELDEQGNVISSTLLHPSKATPSVIDTLRKAGAIEKEDESTLNPSVVLDISNPEDAQISEGFTSNLQTEKDVKTDKTFSENTAASPKPILSTTERKRSSSKKSVAFADDHTTRKTPHRSISGIVHSGLEDDLDAFTFNRGEKVIEIDENDKEVASYPIIPTNESAEDAALRREMLQYGLAEVGSVVAEIDLEERDGEFSDLDDDYDGEYPETDEDEEEDEYGRTAHRVITDEYRQKMLELEEKLNARMLENIGPPLEQPTTPGLVEDVHRLVVVPEERQVGITKPETRKKRVGFAEELDVSPAPVLKTVADQQQAHPLADAIIERKQPTSDKTIVSSNETSKPAKVSEITQSSGGSGKTPTATLVNQVVERSAMKDAVVHSDDGGLDPGLLAQEVVVEYNKMRNRRIQDQGGFTPSAEDIKSPLVENVDGKVKKVSRFKAARLKSGNTKYDQPF